MKNNISPIKHPFRMA